MPLESHSAEAKVLLAAFLTSALTRPQHWYSPSLPQDHPSSLCRLCGLTRKELNLVLKAFGASEKEGQGASLPKPCFRRIPMGTPSYW